jgi:hypothetical protein
MRKLLFLLLCTVSCYGQLPSPSYNNTTTNTLKIKTSATVTTTPTLTTTETDGFQAKISPLNLPISTATQTALDGKGKYDWFTINATKRQDYSLQREFNTNKAYTQLTAKEVNLQQAGDTWSHGAIVNLHQSSTKLYVVSIANTVDTGDNATNVNCFVRLQILQATTGGTINMPILSTTTIAKNGDVVGGKTIISGAGVPNAYIVGDILHIIWAAQCDDGVWYEMHNTINCLTDVIGAPEICTMESGLMTSQTIATHLGLTCNNQLSINGTIASFGGYYYAGVASFDIFTKGAIIRSADFVNWEFVKEPSFVGIDPKVQWEISMGALGSNLYMAMRQIDLDPNSDVNSMILSKLDSSCNVLDWVEVPSITSRPEFYPRGTTELFLAFPTNARTNTVLLAIDPILRNSRPVQDMPTWGNYVSIAQRGSGSTLQFAVRTFGSGVQGLRLSSMNANSVSSTSATTIRDYTSTLTSDAQAQFTARPTGTGTNGFLCFWNSANTITGDTNLFWDNTNKRIGFGTNTPTHPLTFSSTLSGTAVNSGLALYATSDQTTNYERLAIRYNSSSQFLIGSEQGGTGVTKPILINASNRSILINSNNNSQFGIVVSNPVVSSTNAGILRTTGGWSGASGTNTTLQLATTYTHTGTASGRELFISPFYQTTGSGTYNLIDAGTNTAADATGTHTSLFKVNNVGLVNMVNANLSSATASTMAIFDASKNIISAPTATYPSLTELSYLKGATGPVTNITATTSADYYRGDKTMQPLNAAVIGSVLTGYTSGAGTITGSDSVKSAIEKLNGNTTLKADLLSPTFTGTPTAPTATAGTNTTQIASTAFVTSAVVTADSGNVKLTGNQIAIAGQKGFTDQAYFKTVFMQSNTSATTLYIDNSANGIGLNGRNLFGGDFISCIDAGTGNGFVSNIPSGSGFNFVGKNNSINTFTVDKFGKIEASKLNLSTTSGSQAVGNATLASGTITVNTTAATTNSVVMLTRKSSSVTGMLSYSTTNGTLTINSTVGADSGTVSYLIIN